MADFKRILFPTDLSPQSCVAAPYVRDFAKHFGAEVFLLHSEALPCEPSLWQPSPGEVEMRMNQFAKENFEGMRLQQFVCAGDPAVQIVDYARRKQADLIMMPTHGRGPFRRFVLGSVTTKVLHDTALPVWTSAHLEQTPPAPPASLRAVLCAVDLDDIGEHTIGYAGGLARKLGATLTIAHAVPAVETAPEAYLDADFQSDLIRNARQRLIEMQQAAGTNGVLCVGAGNIARFVAHAAKSHGAGMVVIGRGGHGVLGRLRTHDYGIIRECPCPVLSI